MKADFSKILRKTAKTPLVASRKNATRSRMSASFTIKKVDGDKQIVIGEVYAPYVIDSHGEMMLPEDIVKLAHRTLLEKKNHDFDIMHNGKAVKASIIESYIARKLDPDYTEGAWVLAVKILDEPIWQMVKAGKLNGYSLEAMVYKYEAEVTYDYQALHFGITEENDGHFHSFFVEVDKNGRVIGGTTSEEDDEDGVSHTHKILAGTATKASNKHSHRYFLNEID